MAKAVVKARKARSEVEDDEGDWDEGFEEEDREEPETAEPELATKAQHAKPAFVCSRVTVAFALRPQRVRQEKQPSSIARFIL